MMLKSSCYCHYIKTNKLNQMQEMQEMHTQTSKYRKLRKRIHDDIHISQHSQLVTFKLL